MSSLIASCTENAGRIEAEPSCDAPRAREVVERLGDRLKHVSLQAPDSILVREIQQVYAPLVTPDLLERWLTAPVRAPGREVSSPWPERIDIHSVKATGVGLCQVEGEVVYVTSVELTEGGAAMRELVTLEISRDRGWRISAYQTPSSQAADVIRRYYTAIEARDFRLAYELWGGDGAASGQTLEQFVAGFSGTEHVEVEVGRPGQVEAAAGSRYVEVPVIVRAVTDGGEPQQFEGTYVLRRGVVPGGPAEEYRWHIDSAKIARVR